MNDTSTITNADDDKLVAMIAQTKRQLVLAAPGVSDRVAIALSDAWQRLGCDACTVILDVDPEVCRLGYGTFEGLKTVCHAASLFGGLVCHQPGLRIGLLISDDRTLVFSPTPLLIEAGSNAPSRPNAIELGPPPAEIARDLGLGQFGNRDRCIGLDPIQPGRIDEVERDLQAAPPVHFDLARRVHVFTSHFQFVELEMTGCFISRKRVPIPSKLLGLARQHDIERQFHAHFDLVQSGRLEVRSGKDLITEQTLAERRRNIEKRFLVQLPLYGMVVLRANKKRLLTDFEELQKCVKTFSDGVKAQLNDVINKTCETIVDALLPAVERNPPDKYTKTVGARPDSDTLRKMLEEDITRAFRDAEALVKDMQVRLLFKDVAYESLIDPKFIETARKAMPHVEFLHTEYEAAASDEDKWQ